jgi:peptidoglycan/xylan/chitin deacetylase (PgdA/CDA1 family)
VPYTADVNDFRYWNSPGLTQASDFLEYMKETFDVLYKESERGPRMMSIGLHPRMVGRPGRVRAISQFIEYAQQHDTVWFATREEIARAWLELS